MAAERPETCPGCCAKKSTSAVQEVCTLPEMELGGVDDVDTRLRLKAYMMWPENDQAREFYMARNLAWHVAIWPEIVAKRPGDKRIERSGDEFRRRLIDALSSAGRIALGDDAYALAGYPQPLSDEVGRKRMATAGRLLVSMRALGSQLHSLRGGSGLLKAIFLLMNEPRPPRECYTTRKEIFNSWRLYKKSSHLIVARALLYHNGIKEKDVDYAYFWLVMARDYQNFILNSTPLHGTKRPLLTRDELWLVPDSFDLPDFTVPQGTLPSDMIEVVKRYKAPIRH